MVEQWLPSLHSLKHGKRAAHAYIHAGRVSFLFEQLLVHVDSRTDVLFAVLAGDTENELLDPSTAGVAGRKIQDIIISTANADLFMQTGKVYISARSILADVCALVHHVVVYDPL